MAEKLILKAFLFFSFITLTLARPHAALDKNSLLFYDLISGPELAIAKGLEYTTVVLTKTQWSELTAADVSTYRAIILGDLDINDDSPLAIPVLNRDVWSPAILGNIVIVGTDPASHDGPSAGADQLMKSAISFAAADAKTSLYVALSEYYGYADDTLLDQFGEFRVRGNLGCYNKAHIVVLGDAVKGLTDALLSDWGCSVYELFLRFLEGSGKFVLLAIAQDFKDGVFGIRNLTDNTTGLPYITSRSVPPIGCGNGKPDSGEECDDGDTVDGGGGCNLCDATVGFNNCDVTTGCSNTPYGTMCACRPGYRADAPGDDLDKHWRLEWPVPGQEHRVYVKPGVVCDTLCDHWELGAAGCTEVSIGECTAGTSSDPNQNSTLTSSQPPQPQPTHDATSSDPNRNSNFTYNRPLQPRPTHDATSSGQYPSRDYSEGLLGEGGSHWVGVVKAFLRKHVIEIDMGW